MPSRKNPRLIENRVVIAAAIAVFLVLLAGFSGVMLNPGNTLALVDPFHSMAGGHLHPLPMSTAFMPRRGTWATS
jgi:predicted histidine transporter YuiF (NhaC family)